MKAKVPTVKPKEYEDAHAFVLAFFQALGWDPMQQELDPRKVRVHPDRWKTLCNEMKTLWSLKGALVWMNYGPSGDEDDRHWLAEDEVEITPGAMEKVV